MKNTPKPRIWERLYPKTSLHKYISSKEKNKKEAIQKSFEDLCRFHGLEPWQYQGDGNWEALCKKIILHCIPAFKEEKRGRPSKNENEDLKITQMVELCQDFAKQLILDDVTPEELDRLIENNELKYLSERKAIPEATKILKRNGNAVISKGRVTGAVNRQKKRAKNAPDDYIGLRPKSDYPNAK